MRRKTERKRTLQEERKVELPERVLQPHYVIDTVDPDKCREKTSKIYGGLTELKEFEGKTIGEALGMLSKSVTFSWSAYDMQCHVARERIIVKGIRLYKDSQPRIVDINAGVVYDWSGAIIGGASRAPHTL